MPEKKKRNYKFLKLPSNPIASSSLLISSVTDGVGLWMDSKESWESVAANSFLCFCCYCFNPLVLSSALKLPAGLELLSSLSHCSVLLLEIGGCSILAASGSASFSPWPIHFPITQGLRRELNATLSLSCSSEIARLRDRHLRGFPASCYLEGCASVHHNHGFLV